MRKERAALFLLDRADRPRPRTPTSRPPGPSPDPEPHSARRLGKRLDADGNIPEADEPNPSSGSLTSGEYATCYGYTTTGQLATVAQGGDLLSEN